MSRFRVMAFIVKSHYKDLKQA